MRYLLLVVVLVLGVFALVNGFRTEDRSLPPTAPDDSAPGDLSSDYRAAEGGPSEAERAAEKEEIDSLSRPASSDALGRALATILGDLVHGRLGADDRSELESRILDALVDEKLADSLTMENAARSTAERLLEEMRKARSQGAAALPEAQTMLVVQSMAAQLAGKLRRALAMKGDGRPHEGSFFTVGFDFEAPEGYLKTNWDVLGGFDYREGMVLPEAVQKLDGKKIAIAGYMMAIGEFEDIHLFALVESQWSCCFGMPPNLNQIITVSIPDADDGIELLAQPILVYGILEASEQTEDEWVINVYRLRDSGVEILDRH